MKIKILSWLALVALGAAGAAYFPRQAPPTAPMAAADGRKILYYQSAMHPWIKSDRPGKCPICGMNLVPIYAAENSPDTNEVAGAVTLAAAGRSVINVQTEAVMRRPLARTLHLAGRIERNSPTAAWFVFTVYERDLPWLKIGQEVPVSVAAAPDKIYAAQIKLHGTEPFADRDFDEMSASTKMRAEIAGPPVAVGDFGHALFNNLHAESHLVLTTPAVLAVPRSAVVARGPAAFVYVATAAGYYAPRAVTLGRAGDEFYEVLTGLDAGEKVVTTGNVLIDSEAQLTAGQ